MGDDQNSVVAGDIEDLAEAAQGHCFDVGLGCGRWYLVEDIHSAAAAAAAVEKGVERAQPLELELAQKFVRTLREIFRCLKRLIVHSWFETFQAAERHQIYSKTLHLSGKKMRGHNC